MARSVDVSWHKLMNRGIVFDVCALGLAIVLSLWHPAAAWTEQYYTNDFYLPLDRAIRPLVDALPFSVADVLLGAVLAGLGVWWYRLCRRSDEPAWRRVGLALRRTIAVF